MAEKTEFSKLYWAMEKPREMEVIVTRAEEPVRSGPPGQGRIIGKVGVNAHVIIDLNEESNGATRIVRIIGRDPVPGSWYADSTLASMPEWYDTQERFRPEWWLDNGAFVPSNVDQTKLIFQVTWDNATNSGTVIKL